MNVINATSTRLAIVWGLTVSLTAAAQQPVPAGHPIGSGQNWFFAGIADPSLAEYQQIESRIHSLARDYRSQDSDKRRKEIRKELEELTTKQFELRLEIRKKELEQLKKQLEAVAQKVQRREDLREQIIQRRVTELTKEDAELAWDPFMPSRTGSPIGLPGPAVPPAPGVHGLAGSSSRVPKPASVPLGSATAPGSVPSSFGPASGLDNTPAPGGVLGDYPVPWVRPNAMTVAEARTRLDIARRHLQMVKTQFAAGETGKEKLSDAEGACELAQLACKQAQHQFETQRNLLRIELDRAKLELEAASAKLAEIQKLSDSAVVSRSELRQSQLLQERAQLNLQRQEALMKALEFNAQQEEEGDE